MASAWDRLKPHLAALREDPTHPLRGYPDPRVDQGRSPPFRISLACWATNVAVDLHAGFGAEVELVVGHLRYPDPVPPDWLERVLTRRAQTHVASFLRASLIQDLEVASGEDARTPIQTENRGSSALDVRTNGQLTGTVIDPVTDQVVGTYAGAQRLPLVVFTAEPDEVVEIPILVGTSSLVPTLGYAIPPGRWDLEAKLDTNLGRLRTPKVSFKVR